MRPRIRRSGTGTAADAAPARPPRRARRLLTGLALGLGLVLELGLMAASLPGPLRPWIARADDTVKPGLTLARLKYGGGGDWYSNPTSLPNLARELETRTSIPIAQVQEARVAPLDEALFFYPLVYINGHGKVSLTDNEIARLRRYLIEGGFLWADDNYGMDESFRALMRRVFPERPLVEVPFEHPIYHAFYDFPQGPPKIHEHDRKPPRGYGIFDRGRLVVFYTYEADIGDGLEDEGVHDDPPEKREEAMRMAINIVVHAVMGEASPEPVGAAVRRAPFTE